MRGLLIVCLLFSMCMCVGCADMKTPNLQRIVTKPFGTSSTLSLGMQKDQVVAEWDDPDIVNKLKSGQFGSLREEWIYVGRSDFPIDFTHGSQTTYLLFEDDALIEWGEKVSKSDEE